MTLTTRRLAALILFIGLFAMAMRVAVDSDTFWHLRAGTWMIENRRLLNFDVFSHTRLGQPWINHSWLSEIPMAALYSAFGFAGLNIATAVVVWLTFFFVYHSGEGGSYLRAFAVVLAAAASGVYWSARPQIVSMLLAAIFNYVLILRRWRGVNRLWLLPLLMLAWVNLHGGFAIGFILLGATIAGELVEAALSSAFDWRLAGRQAKEWAVIAAACAAAAVVNPYGAQMLLYPFKTVSIGVLQNYIQEWQSPNFHAREAQVFIVMWLAAFGAVGLSRRRLEPTDLFIFSAFTALALLAGRHIAVFAVAAAPILMTHADSAIHEAQQRWPRLKIAERDTPPSRVANLANWILLLVVAAAAAVKISLPLDSRTVSTAIARSAPVGAAEYLKANRPQGRMFNAYNFGGYLVWALYPEIPVYVDGRTDLYDDKFLNEYLNIYLAGQGWEQTLAARDIGFVVVEPQAPLAGALAAQPNWLEKYRDLTAVIYVNAER